MRHYSEWMNNLVDEDLVKYQYREVLVIQPSWMMTRETFDRVGGYVEEGEDNKPYPEV
jgi:singapore isolate B (sub-type 7) whole genome shotgun sequence assembly, scaffold_24